VNFAAAFYHEKATKKFLLRRRVRFSARFAF
jgi:hypothetical protein